MCQVTKLFELIFMNFTASCSQEYLDMKTDFVSKCAKFLIQTQCINLSFHKRLLNWALINYMEIAIWLICDQFSNNDHKFSRNDMEAWREKISQQSKQTTFAFQTHTWFNYVNLHFHSQSLTGMRIFTIRFF